MSTRFKSHQIKGDGIGSKQVFPTINLTIPKDDFRLEIGVYAAFCTIGKTKYKAALHYGPRPTFGKNENTLELYILADILDFYEENQEIKVEIIEKIRPTKTFTMPSELKIQIEDDVLKINKILDSESA